MGWFTSITRTAGALARSPIGKIAGALPGVGTAISAVGLASTAYGAYKAISGSSGSTAGLPALPGGAGALMASPIAPGSRSLFRNDPNLPAMLQGYAIPKAALKTYYRAPKGFVVLKDQAGDPYGMPKAIARQMHLWRPAKKPLLSVRDTSALRHAGRAIKKLQNAEKMARHIANWHSPRRAPAKREIVIERKGK